MYLIIFIKQIKYSFNVKLSYWKKVLVNFFKRFQLCFPIDDEESSTSTKSMTAYGGQETKIARNIKIKT